MAARSTLDVPPSWLLKEVDWYPSCLLALDAVWRAPLTLRLGAVTLLSVRVDGVREGMVGFRNEGSVSKMGVD